MAGKFHYGGQAVMEGVMMRGQNTIATAVRRPNGEVAVENKPLSKIYTGKMRQMPFARGIIVLIESIVLGIQGLLFSANVVLEEEEESISGGSTWLILAFSMVLSVCLFFLAPLFLTKLLDPYIESSLVFHLIEGGIRLVIFLIFLKLIGLMPDIKRTFSYHGAEHKTINAYENGVPMEVEDVQRFSTAHARLRHRLSAGRADYRRYRIRAYRQAGCLADGAVPHTADSGYRRHRLRGDAVRLKAYEEYTGAGYYDPRIMVTETFHP